MTRQKLTTKICGNFELGVAGAGNNGDLIDTFVERLQENLIANPNIRQLSELKKFIAQEILDFRRNEADGYSRSDKEMKLIIGVRSLDPPACIVWKAPSSRLIEVTDYALAGFEDERYEYLVENLRQYKGPMPLAQGIFLGLHLMGVAENTSNSVKSPITVVILKSHGMRQEDQAVINKLRNRVETFSTQINNMMLTCPDTGVKPSGFVRGLREFVETVVTFRREYIEELLGEKIAQGLNTVNDDYNLIPLGTEIVYYPTDKQAEAMRKMHEDMVKTLREQESGQQDYPRILANLAAVKACSQAGPAVDMSVKEAAGVALNELLQATLMGPYKITERAAIALGRLFEFSNARFDLGFGEEENRRLRMMALDQAIAVIQSEFNSQNQAPSPATPVQS